MKPHWSVSGKKASQPARKSARVLHVDDEKDWLALVRTALEDAGHVVLSAQDATEAMTLADAGKPDVIILDLDLKGESGVELMKYFCRNHPGIPIILFTGLAHDDETILTMLQQGAYRYVRKGPLDVLCRAVEAAVVR
jgi:two-component system response regulator ResD